MTKKEIYAEMTAIINESKGNLSPEKQAAYEALEKRFEEADKQEAIVKRHEERRAALENAVEKRHLVVNSNGASQEEFRDAFYRYICSGDDSEIRNMNTYTTVEGGAVVPVSLHNQIQTVVAGLNIVRKLPGINVIQTSNLLEIPFGGKTTIGYVEEAPSGSFGFTTSAMSKKSLRAFKFGGIVKVSEELLNDAAISVEAHLANRLGMDMAEFEEQEFLVGAGGTGITGFLNQTSNLTNAVVSTGSAAVGDSLIDAFYTMKAGHQSNAAWVVGPDLLRTMQKAKDGSGQFLFDVAGSNGVSTFLGRPVFQSSQLPSVGAASAALIGALVDARYLNIGDRTATTVRRLGELYSATGEVGFRVHKRSDILLSNADALLKLVKQ